MTRTRAYLAGLPNRAAADALTALGYHVTAPALVPLRADTLADLLDAVEVDLDALAAADVLVVGDGEPWEAALAPALGIPVRTLWDLVPA